MKDKSKPSLQWNSNSKKKHNHHAEQKQPDSKDIVYKGKNKHTNLARNVE